MSILLQILFWVSVLSILHTYVFYPLILWLFSLFKKSELVKIDLDFTPDVHVIFAAFNEEEVIEQKIRSIYKSNYPKDRIHVLIGSDASTDLTENKIISLQKEFQNLDLRRFETRTGKSGIINQLVEQCSSEFILGTDANIIFDLDTIPHFIKHFKNESIQLVGGNIIYYNTNSEGISTQENAYLSLENRIKKMESNLWQKVIGVEGGLYCIRKRAFSPIPPLTFMEDFYITMTIFKKNGAVLFEEESKGYEDVSTLQEEEFKRKTRISIGNFQNLNRFYSLLLTNPFPLGFAFFSHKILRWLTPFLGILSFISAILLSNNLIYLEYIYLLISLLLLSLIDWILYSIKIKTGPLRYIGHFTMMNLALLNGFFKYIKGVRTNVWQPTERNQ